PRPAGGVLRPPRGQRPPPRPTAVRRLLRLRPPGRVELPRRGTVAAHQTGHRPPPRRARLEARHLPGPGRNRRRQPAPRPPPGRVAPGPAAERQRRAPVPLPPLLPRGGVAPAAPDAVAPPPAGVTGNALAAAIRHAATTVSFTTPDHPDKPGGWTIRWGEQL